jgi:hypothetical protein
MMISELKRGLGAVVVKVPIRVPICNLPGCAKSTPKSAFTLSRKGPFLSDEFARRANRPILSLYSARNWQIRAEQTRRASTLLDSVNAP